MGKSSGNLALESWLAMLNFYEQKEMYNIRMVLSQINILQFIDLFNASKRTVMDIIMSILNLSTDYLIMVENILEQDISLVFI